MLEASKAVSLRPTLPGDAHILFQLFLSSRPELSMLPQQLVEMQYVAQQRAYEFQYPGPGYQIVLHGEDVAGKVWIADLPDELHLVDIAVLPEMRNSGIGSWIVKNLQADAIAKRKPIRSSVFRFNPGSLRFHQRLGFVISREDEMTFYLDWTHDVSNSP